MCEEEVRVELQFCDNINEEAFKNYKFILQEVTRSISQLIVYISRFPSIGLSLILVRNSFSIFSLIEDL